MTLTDAQKIAKQVNFYFSDSNLPYDKFLWTLRANTPGGWIPIETIAGFKKMKMITEDSETVINALKENESEIYELDTENKNIRRKTEVVEQDHTSRSIYIKGLPLVDVDAKDPVAAIFELQDKIDELFSEKGKVLSIRTKKNNDRPKKFKGSAYVEFESPEEAKKVADLKEIELDGQKLEITYKPIYHEQKAEQYKDSPTKPHARPFNAFKAQKYENQKQNGKRKNANGFAKDDNKKTKVEEPKSEESNAVEANTEEAKPEEVN